MNFKTTIVLLVTALLVGGFYLFVDRQRPTTEDLEKQARRLFHDWKSEEVVRIDIARTDTASAEIVLARADTAAPWRLEKPLATDADGREVDSLLSSMAYADRARPEAERDFDPRAIGLDAPRARATFRLADKGERTIAFGKDDLSGKNVYAQVDGGAVVLAPKRVYDAVAKDPADLRARALFSVDRWNVDRVTLRGPRMTLRFRRDDDRWLLEEPEEDVADKAKLDELLTLGADLKAKSFADEAPADLAPFGLAEPNAVLTLQARGVSETAVLGAKAPGGGIYAKRADRPNVVTVDDTITEKIVWDADHWRSKELLHFGHDRVDALEVRPPAEPGGARIVHEGLAWRFAEPVTASADAKACDDLVRALGALEVVQIVREKAQDLANFGLDKPTRVTVATPKGRHVFLLGRASGRENGWYVQREGKDPVLEVVFAEAPDLLHAWPVLRERALVPPSEDEIVRLEWKTAPQVDVPLVRLPDGGWSTPGAQADRAAADAIAQQMAALTATRVLSPGDEADLGLASPWLSIEATRQSGARLALDLGKTTPEHERYAALSLGSERIVFTLAEDAVKVLAKDPRAQAPPAPPPQDAPAAASGSAR
jgi:hypothetical protein